MTVAVFTLLYSEDYLPGALVLAIALRKLLTNSSLEDVKLCILIDKKLFETRHLKLLSEYYHELYDIDPIVTHDFDTLNNDLGRPELNKTYSKILLWSKNQYDKILYLDVDTLPNVNGSITVLDLLKLDFPKDKILAAPDSGFPDVFNSGMFLMRPNPNDFTHLKRMAQSSDDVSFDGADQGLLNQYFNPNPDWVSDLLSSNRTNVIEADSFSTSSWIKLPFLFNVTPSAQYEYLPAFKYFTEDGKEPPESLDIEHGSHAGEYPGVKDALNRYHATAMRYFSAPSAFGAKAQTRLVHYIGPFKPWNSDWNDPLFGEWWSFWFGEFHDSIENVLGRPHVHEEDHTDHVQQEAPQEPHIESKEEFDPATLCDPANYQHIPETVASSADSRWDPATAPPPAAEPEFKGSLDFGEFKNSWDEEPKYEGRESNEVEYEPAPGHDDYGYHPDQRPERVFDLSQDFVPSHLLYQAAEVDEEQVQVSREDETVGQMEERFQEMGIIENDVEMDPEISEQFDSGASPVFPWEHKQRQPERVFDW